MFDVGFSELLMVALVSLLVIGPERLPKAARLAGFWIGKSRSMIAQLKAEIHTELQTEELRQIFNEQLNMQELENSLEDAKDSVRSLQSSIEQVPESLQALKKLDDDHEH
jgi:sec-independent protein translocase protein TatB